MDHRPEDASNTQRGLDAWVDNHWSNPVCVGHERDALVADLSCTDEEFNCCYTKALDRRFKDIESRKHEIGTPHPCLHVLPWDGATKTRSGRLLLDYYTRRIDALINLYLNLQLYLRLAELDLVYTSRLLSRTSALPCDLRFWKGRTRISPKDRNMLHFQRNLQEG